jgi:endonuclease-8
MPEVIEVRKYADFMKSKMKNKSIESINIINGRYKKHKPFEMYSDISADLPLKLLDVKTKGKLLYMVFENDYYIFSTLGLMGGWVYLAKDKTKYEFNNMYDYDVEDIKRYHTNALNHLNVEFKTKEGSLYYYDTLSFGTLKVIKGETELNKKLNTIGPDIMDINTTFEVYKSRITKKTYLNKKIGNVIMNQKVISGVGNYLRADILWVSKISPFRNVEDLKEAELMALYTASRNLTWGQFDYDFAIKSGIFKKDIDFPFHHKRYFFVYRQDTDIFGNKVSKEELYEGSQKRTIFYVPEIQK